MEAKWMSDRAIPAIGERVEANMNGLGWGECVGYWAEEGYLGVMVKFDDPPAWYLKNCDGKNDPGVLFGPEVK